MNDTCDFLLFKERRLQILCIWGLDLIVMIVIPKKKTQADFDPMEKCVTDELLGRMTQKKMAFKNKTVVSHFLKFIVHGVGETHCSLASRSVLACWWQNLMMVEKDMMNFRLNCLISSLPQI